MPTPAPSELALPLWGQITAVLVFIGGALGVVSNAWRSKPKPEPQNDAVVISGAFADAQPIRDLTAAVREMKDAMREVRDATGRFDSNQAERTRDTIGAMIDVKREAQATNEELCAIREVVRLRAAT